MKKLIDAYRAKPTGKALAKLGAHLDKHPMCVVMIGDADIAFLRSLGLVL